MKFRIMLHGLQFCARSVSILDTRVLVKPQIPLSSFRLDGGTISAPWRGYELSRQSIGPPIFCPSPKKRNRRQILPAQSGGHGRTFELNL